MVAMIAPYRYLREELRAQVGDFVEVYVNGSLAVCEARDVKRLYPAPDQGKLSSLQGLMMFMSHP